MTLDEILGQLNENVKRKSNDEDSSKIFYIASNELDKLERIDPNTEEGLTKYREITGEDPASVSFEGLEFRRKGYLTTGRKHLEKYVVENFGKVADELNEEVLANLSYTCCLEGDSADKEMTEYNSVRRTVSDAREKIQKIKENTKAYIAEEIKNEKSQSIKEYLSGYPNELIEFEERKALHNVSLAIEKYGARNFLMDTKKHFDALSKGETLSKLEEKIKSKIKVKEREKGKDLNSVERAKLFSDDYKKLKELSGEYERDIEIGKRLIPSVMSHAINTTREKEKNKEKDSK
ncbi:hypothetical protein KAI32_03975 [Candidatus Pacearchaeota archaeon]|nr:hypothetical protein [Candidatus Pacearchaeota archaeon]